MFGEHTRKLSQSTITSAQNPLLKEIRKAVAKGSTTPDGFCVAETPHLAEEALRSPCEVSTLILSEEVSAGVERHLLAIRRVPVVRLSPELFKGIAATEAPQGVIALAKPPDWAVSDVLLSRALAVVLDGIQDPGNAGAIMRSAEAFGSTGIVFLKGCVSPYNPKAVRASAGSLFRLPFVVNVDAAALVEESRNAGVDLIAAMPRANVSLPEARLSRACAFVVGAEGSGVGRVISENAQGIRIPTMQVESLNASIAASILLYEAWRQRQRS